MWKTFYYPLLIFIILYCGIAATYCTQKQTSSANLLSSDFFEFHKVHTSANVSRDSPLVLNSSRSKCQIRTTTSYGSTDSKVTTGVYHVISSSRSHMPTWAGILADETGPPKDCLMLMKHTKVIPRRRDAWNQLVWTSWLLPQHSQICQT